VGGPVSQRAIAMTCKCTFACSTGERRFIAVMKVSRLGTPTWDRLGTWTSGRTPYRLRGVGGCFVLNEDSVSESGYVDREDM
jgi:hypothetical protein